jgi:hypothetical protein
VRQRAPQLSVDGPIQYDPAVDAGVAAAKLPGSTVAGHATVFIFPDLNTANNPSKAVQRSAGAVAIGPVLQGLRKPVNDLSRGATVHDIVNTVAITAIQAQQQRPRPGRSFVVNFAEVPSGRRRRGQGPGVRRDRAHRRAGWSGWVVRPIMPRHSSRSSRARAANWSDDG